MNRQEILIQAIAATPNSELCTLSQFLTCEIRSASLVCILGQRINVLNACMEMLAGINAPYAGSINYFGDLFNNKNDNNYSKIAYLYHNSTLLSTLNGIDNIKVPALYHHLGSKQEINAEVDILLAELEYEANHRLLPAFMDTLQKRHLLIIRTLMLKPRVLFIENPFMSLDREQVRVFGKYLARLVTEKNITVIASNVNLDFVQSHADQIIYLASESIHVFKERDAFYRYIQAASI
jgi:ABC-type multidrug transport system ATPase subunit